ncbi:MAG: DUF1287 domain-containing protein, partial [Clostridia bacterium]|nr:DUF1287 domain-containing protein [Clostridia bacterium]
MKKMLTMLLIILIFSGGFYFYQSKDSIDKNQGTEAIDSPPALKIEKLVLEIDQDGDGILDLDDIVEGARKEVENQPRYKSAYYSGGYPPQDEGVCTDVIWRAYKNAGYNLKELIDKDIRENTGDYPRVEGRP